MQASTRDGGTQAAARRARRRKATIATLAVAAVALAGGVLVTLSQASVREAGTNDVTLAGIVDELRPGHRVCQDDERIPADTAAIELTATPGGSPPPTLVLQLRDAATLRPIAGGVATWGDETATFALRPRLTDERAVRVCLRLRATGPESAARLFGAPAMRADSATHDGESLGGRLRLDYVRDGEESWWALASTVVRRIGLAHAWSGASVALAAALLTLSSIALAAWLLVRPS